MVPEKIEDDKAKSVSQEPGKLEQENDSERMAPEKVLTPALPASYPVGLPRENRRTKPLTAAFVALVLFAVSFFGGWLGALSYDQNQATSTSNINKQTVTSESKVIQNIAKTVGDSVVSITATQGSTTGSLYGFFGGGSSKYAGTGIIISADGLILTNRHVIPSGTTGVNVTLADGTEFSNVKIVGRTSNSDSLDVAFLKIQNLGTRKLKPAILGDSSRMQVGDNVVAIGNALGQFQNTVTSGIISGYGRSVQASDSTGTVSENLDDLFQTDAAINEGNSGGPLVNLSGQVIGINTAIASDSQSIGFAIPINDVAGLIKSVQQTGTLQRPYLGVMYVPITSDVVQQYNLGTSQGAYIPYSKDIGQSTVKSGGPASEAGVKEGDIITKVDGISINQSTSLTSVLDKSSVGQKIVLTIVRGNKTITLDVTLGVAPTN